MCGIAGAINVPDASECVLLMLKQLQHRGQAAAGIASLDAYPGLTPLLYSHRGLGWVNDAFRGVVTKDRPLSRVLPGNAAIGHVRYPTSGDSESESNIQPLATRFEERPFALAHNGNLTNEASLRADLSDQGAAFSTTSDSELILHLLERTPSHLDAMTRLYQATRKAQGAYALLLLSTEGLAAAIDPYGFRPLVTCAYKGGHLIASEECAFRPFPEATDITHLRPNSLWTRLTNGCKEEMYPLPWTDIVRSCSFETLYFSKPESELPGGRSVQMIRERLGRLLASNETALKLRRPDVVAAVPDSSNAMAVEYAAGIGAPYKHVLIRSHETGRTFTRSSQGDRDLAVRMKFNVVRDVVRHKRVAVVDDSIVRGTTIKKIIRLLREAGAAEVHVRIGSPQVIHPCFWGIDTPNFRELLAFEKPPADITSDIGADSLEYLPVRDFLFAHEDTDGRRHCSTCFTGIPPIPDQPIPAENLVRRR